MSPISQTEFNRILIDASAHYKHPENVATDDRLTREQKIKVLKQWAYDVHEMEVAQGENMQPKDSDELILDQVLRALRKVENS